MAVDLANKKCVPCEGRTLPLPENAIQQYLAQLNTQWEVIRNENKMRIIDGSPESFGAKIHRQFVFKNFVQAMAWVNKVADIAEAEGHHPDIYIFYNKVTIELWTHAIGGLSVNDFIVAAKIEVL